MLIKDKDITSYQLLLIKQDRVLVLASLTSFFDYTVMYRSIEASTSPPPPQGIPRTFDTFAVPGRREFDYQSLPGGGEFDPHALGVGNLNSTLNFMRELWCGELSWGRHSRGFSWKSLCLCGQLVTRFVPYLKVFKF